jgi:hypothetical protein
MRFLVSDVLTGACFAAIIVLCADRSPKVGVRPVPGTAIATQESVQRPQPQFQASAERASADQSAIQPGDRVRTDESERPTTAIETASITAEDPQKLETPSLSRLPSFARPEPKVSGGLGAAADGGIDAYVPPIVRQRPVTPPLAGSVDGKPKGKVKVKAAASAKTKNGAKQASRASKPASVER